MTVVAGQAGEVEVRWLAGLGSSPGAVDLTIVSSLGPVAKAVTLPEALTMAMLIDALCPGTSHLFASVSQLAADHSTPRGSDR